ncbi:hypothetical protein PENTCL1PPCAC_8926, partial [Pristionchus entomophagus]
SLKMDPTYRWMMDEDLNSLPLAATAVDSADYVMNQTLGSFKLHVAAHDDVDVRRHILCDIQNGNRFYKGQTELPTNIYVRAPQRGARYEFHIIGIDTNSSIVEHLKFTVHTQADPSA